MSEVAATLADAGSVASSTTDKNVWSLNIYTMAGERFVVSCPEMASTLVRDIKKKMFELNDDWTIDEQCLMARINDQIIEEIGPLQEPASKRQCIMSENVGRKIGNFVNEQAKTITNESDNMPLMPILFQDHATLGECGLANGSELDLLVRSIEWRSSDIVVQEKTMAGEVVDFTNKWDGNKFDSKTFAAIAHVLKV
jgi:hypothetical protein